MKRLIFYWFALLVGYAGQAQNVRIDSLQLKLKSSTGTERVDILNNLLGEYICSQDSVALHNYRYINELLELEKYPEGELVALKHYGSMKYCAGDLDSTIYYYRQALTIGLENSLYLNNVKLLSSLGFYFQTAGNFDSSAYYFNKGLSLAKQIGDSVSMGSTSVGLGTLYQHQGLLDSALISYFYALKIAEEINNKPLFITAKLNIATFYYDHQPNKLSISDFLELLKVTRTIGDKKRELSVLEWLGYLQADSGRYDLAIKYLEEGLAVNKVQKDQNIEILLLQGISHVYNLSRDNEKSIITNNKIIELSLSSGYELYLPSLYANNVKNYLVMKKYENAIKDGLKAKEAGQKSDQVELYYNILQDLALAYNKLGLNDKAYETQLEYTKLNEEILDAEKSKQITEIDAKYETEKKEAEIVSLSQQASIQSLEIKQKNQAIIIGLVVILFVLAAIYFVYKQRETKKQQSQTELEQRFLRSQLNPHFISNALVAVQSFMLKNDSESAALYLTKFSKLMREILENSRKEFIPVEEEISMLRNYLDIHKLRLGSFEYSIELDENIDSEMDTIPPMFVQPFVENAVEHGIANLKNGEIILRFKKDGDYISIEVNDNGAGLSQNIRSEHTSLSSKIIQERMALFNRSLKRKIKLVVKNLKNKTGEISGTKVELKVPFGYI